MSGVRNGMGMELGPKLGALPGTQRLQQISRCVINALKSADNEQRTGDSSPVTMTCVAVAVTVDESVPSVQF